MDVGFVGVGAMGATMAGHVAEAGFAVKAFDTDAGNLSAATTGDIAAANSMDEVAAGSDVVVVVVSTDDQSRGVVSALLAAGPKDGQVIVIAATNHPGTMIELAADCAEHGVGFVDAPICYGLQGAKHGNLISLCGGSDGDIAKVITGTDGLQPQCRTYGACGYRPAWQGLQQHDALGGLRGKL